MEVVVVFDFDWSLVNENTDTYVIEQLTPELYPEFLGLRKKVQWTKLMDMMVGKMMRERGVSKEVLSECLRKIPFSPEMFQATQHAAKCGAKMFIISDSNTFYINEILEEHNMKSLWNGIFTNPTEFEDDILRISSFQDPIQSHGCNRCPVNICKGSILNDILGTSAASQQHRRVIYVGDGGGDVCPCLRLCHNDIVCCRRNWTLHNELSSTADVAATIVPWVSGEEVLALFHDVIKEQSVL